MEQVFELIAMIQRSPQEAYRSIDFNARISCASASELVHLCYEHLVGALGTAIHAEARGDNGLKSRSMTRALSAIMALQMGVTGNEGVSGALRHMYEGARRAILDSALQFDSPRIAVLREDFAEIGQALRAG